MKLTANASIHGFSIHAHEELPEIQGEAFVGVHDVSGAKLLYLCNDDNNKSFAIGFRTPPQDDTGVFHILEHSVLCGSRKFPVKEPFVDLLKSSMQTFLNAMTFGDKTLYPVASTNEQDLINLMDVYLDAVFHPRIYEKRAIFEQEGWHYELNALGEGDPAELGPDESTLVHNGVVFNEMKGALSDASSVLYDELQKTLFPDTCYAFESGGTPAAIPTLTYEDYLDEHRRHYRTDNSYIILYGNLDIDRTLAFIDEQYLSPVAAEQQKADAERAGLEPLKPRTIEYQEPLETRYVRHEMDTAPENACAACGYVIGSSTERMRTSAVEILLDALFGSNEAPLKRALLDAGIAHDVVAYVSDALAQPFAIVQVQMPAEDAGVNLMETLDREVRKMLDTGLDTSLVEAALSHEEFQMREHDLGYPDGVINAILSLSGWLYDDDAPLDYLRYERMYAELRENLETGYFETLCKELFCENPHRASVEVVPTPGVSHDDTAERLSELNRSLSTEDRKRIIDEEAALRRMQEEPDSPEDIATLPRLGIADIDEAPAEPSYELLETTPVPCLRHSVDTRGIVYAYQYFDMEHLTFEDLPYVSILTAVLGKLDTDKHTAAEIDTLVQGKLGNLLFMATVFEPESDSLSVRPAFVVSSSSLSKNVSTLASLPLEIMTGTDFSNTGKILDILKQRKIMLEQGFSNAGHACAALRCKSYYSAAGVINEQLSNVDFYRFICDLIDNYDERSSELAQRLRDVANRLFCKNACTISFAGADDDFNRFWDEQPICPVREHTEPTLVTPQPVVKNEAFIVPSDVCFAALGWNARLLGKEIDGSWAVAGRALSYDYLWNVVRVKGGAYGTGFKATHTGNMRFYSYRDPHLDQTLDAFAHASEWLEHFDPPRESFEGFVVAATAGFDAPEKPRLLIRRQANDFFCAFTPENRRALRNQIVSTSAQSVRTLAGTLHDMADKRAICVFGNKEILESSTAGLEVIALVG